MQKYLGYLITLGIIFINIIPLYTNRLSDINLLKYYIKLLTAEIRIKSVGMLVC